MKNLSSNIAKSLKSLRQKNGWSLDVVSKKTGVSKAMLGQIERGESSPTVITLWKIANGFETSFSSFVEGKTAAKAVERGTAKLGKAYKEGDKYIVKTIFPFDENLSYEVFLIELLPGCEHLSPPHKGRITESVVVSEGEMEVLTKGVWQKLKKNEGLRFNASKPHGYRNKSKKKASFYNIINYSAS